MFEEVLFFLLCGQGVVQTWKVIWFDIVEKLIIETFNFPVRLEMLLVVCLHCPERRLLVELCTINYLPSLPTFLLLLLALFRQHRFVDFFGQFFYLARFWNCFFSFLFRFFDLLLLVIFTLLLLIWFFCGNHIDSTIVQRVDITDHGLSLCLLEILLLDWGWILGGWSRRKWHVVLECQIVGCRWRSNTFKWLAEVLITTIWQLILPIIKLD